MCLDRKSDGCKKLSVVSVRGCTHDIQNADGTFSFWENEEMMASINLFSESKINECVICGPKHGHHAY